MYRFANLMGTVYSQGNLEFSRDGFTLLSPVGNRITLFDLRDHVSRTLPVESSVNITCLTLSPNGILLLAGNTVGEIYVISLVSQSVLHVMKVGGPVRIVKYSPDGQLVAVAKADSVGVYAAPTFKVTANPYELKRVYRNLVDIQGLDWSFDSRLLAIASTDNYSINPVVPFTNFTSLTLTDQSAGGNVGLSFLSNSYEIYSVSKGGVLRISSPSKEISLFREAAKGVRTDEDFEETIAKRPRLKDDKEPPITFSVAKKFYYNELFKKGEKRPPVTSLVYNKDKKLLVTGFEGKFFIHEMPDFNLVHSLEFSEHTVTTVALNSTAEWIACGLSGRGEIMVYEWQSQTHIMKQQGHQDVIDCFAYSPDGRYIASGGVDCKVKVWNTQTSFSFMTFDAHTAPITGIVFTQKGKAVLSASLDGTVRAFDMKRYRNFRTFSATRRIQFGCLTVDDSGELVVAGGRDEFDLYLWSMKTGHLLEVLSGHEASIEAVAFSPSAGSSRLASVSTDKTLKIWESIGSSGLHENILLGSEGTCLAFSPDGQHIAVGTLDGNLSFFSAEGGVQKGSINGRINLQAGRSLTDKTTAEHSRQAKQFRTISYSPDGKFLLAAGPSMSILMYNTEHQILVSSFRVSKNHSYDGLEGHIHHRKIGEFGILDLVEGREDKDQLALPGVLKGDMASRMYQNELRVTCVRFSPSGRTWAAATTEGLLVYSSQVVKLFDPIGADEEVTPQAIKKLVEKRNVPDKAIMMALRLNMKEFIKLAVESVRVDSIEFVAKELPFQYVKLLLRYLAQEVRVTRRVELYLIWIESLFKSHLWDIKAHIEEGLAETLTEMRKNISETAHDMKMLEHNLHTLRYFFQVSNLTREEGESSDEIKSEPLENDDKDSVVLSESESDSD